MARAKNDEYKRRFAQTLNHMSEAVLCIHDVYTAFDEQVSKLTAYYVENPNAQTKSDIARYEAYRENLKQIMMYLVVPREEISKFIASAYGLDEESIRVYLR